MNVSTIKTLSSYKFVLYRTKFWIELPFLIMGIITTLLIFAYFIRHKTARKAPHNLGIFVLLLVNFLQLLVVEPFAFVFFYVGFVTPTTSAFCTFWTASMTTLDGITNCLLATISVQRHMLIFYAYILQNHRARFLLHYLPIILCIIYPIIFHFFAIIIYPCDGTQWDFASNMCGFADCYIVDKSVLATYDMVANNIILMIVDVVSNIVLITRIIRQRRRFRQANVWKQHRRLTLQLFCVSCLFIFTWGPATWVIVAETLFDPTFLYEIERDYLFELPSMEFFLLPIVCLFFFPDFLTWIRSLCCYRRENNAIRSSQQQNEVKIGITPHAWS